MERMRVRPRPAEVEHWHLVGAAPDQPRPFPIGATRASGLAEVPGVHGE